MTSKKQIEANRRNAQKSTGPKTDTGKAIARRNAFKHGLQARAIVIDDGEGLEDRQAFDRLTADLLADFQPVGPMEEMLVEKIVICYWRQMRACRCETGMIRQQLDTLTEDYYAQRGNLTDAEIDAAIAEKRRQISQWQEGLDEFTNAFETGDDLALMYDWQEQWMWVFEVAMKERHPDMPQVDLTIRMRSFLRDCRESEGRQGPAISILKGLRLQGKTDRQIWQMHIEIIQQHIDQALLDIERLEKDKHVNRLRIDARRRRGALPEGWAMNLLLRYETANDRQLTNAIKQLMRLQKQRGFEPGESLQAADERVDADEQDNEKDVR